jgi:hypothetical protein
MGDRREEVPRTKVLERALALVCEAMDLLDAHSASPLGAAHLAMARQTIEDDLNQSA